MRVVSITKSSVNKGVVVDGSHLIEEIVCIFGTFHGLLTRIIEFLHGEDDCLVEVEYAQIVEAAEDIEVDVIFHEFELLVEGVVPDYLHVIHYLPVILVPIQPLAHDQCEPHVHLDGRDELVDDFESGLVVG